MATRSKSNTAEEIAAIEELMSDLEKRLRRLNGSASREFTGAASDINEFVNDALSGIMKRVKDGAGEITETVADEATRIGGDVAKKVFKEVEARPILFLAAAAGIGFLLGLSRR